MPETEKLPTLRDAWLAQRKLIEEISPPTCDCPPGKHDLSKPGYHGIVDSETMRKFREGLEEKEREHDETQ